MKNTDKIVGHVYSTFDYEKFSFFEENRGAKGTKGFKSRRGNTIQRMINDKEYYDEIGIVKCNSNFRILDGRHNFEIRKANKMDIRYIIIEHADFAAKDLLDSVYSLNKHNSSWSNKDLFNSAVESKRKVAILIFDLIKRYKYSFTWIEVLMILKNDFTILTSWGRNKMKPKVFSEPALIERAASKEFQRDFNLFLRVNDRIRNMPKKVSILRSVYSIIHRSTLVNSFKLVKALEEMSEGKVRGYKDIGTFQTDLIKQYNTTNGESISPEAVIDQVKNFGRGKNVKVKK